MKWNSRAFRALYGKGLLFVAAIVALGCGRNSATGMDGISRDLSSIKLTVVSGQNQDAVSGGRLPNPILVRIERNGAPWAGTTVWYEVSQQFSPILPSGISSKLGAISGTGTSDSQGIATINPTFDSGTGSYSVFMYYFTCSVLYFSSCPPENLVKIGTVSVSGAVLAGP